MKAVDKIVKEVSLFEYQELSKMFEHLEIKPQDWPVEDAKKEINMLVEKKLHLKRKYRNPTLTIIAGIPCSGKTTLTNKLVEDDREAIRIQFDEIMECLSYYQTLLRTKGNKIAFEKCEPIARIAGYQLLKASLEKSLRIIFEHSSAPEQHLKLYKIIKEEYKYKVRMFFLEVSLETALSRNQEGRNNNRYTDPELIKNRYAMMQELLPKYKKIIPVNILFNE
ncbi:zeta toxin family protein [uncultured Draconibacterium sp.]|uniref:zeta toxin family protein n=1 Tax=uncultured Draconibacterium sp. TaxID=1573823 RepID=UPI0029C9133F|nr:zeta toxin family protein [uncultured Draconibacterium sp.]